MNVYELTKNFMPALRALRRIGFDISNIENIEIYEEYKQRKDAGEKKMFIFTSLADKYKMSERSVQRIIKKFQTVI